MPGIGTSTCIANINRGDSSNEHNVAIVRTDNICRALTYARIAFKRLIKPDYWNIKRNEENREICISFPIFGLATSENYRDEQGRDRGF